MRYVIIGNSTAATGCVEGIRSTDKTGEIILISSEKYHTYSRPLISYLLEGKTDLQRIKYRPDDFYERNGVTAMTGETAKSVNGNTVELESGERIKFDRLMIAAGSVPFVPAFRGIETVPVKFSFMSLDDALSLEKALRPDARVLILGAGLIGLKCAEGICDRVGEIAVVDLADRILPSILTETAAGLAEKYPRDKGIEFYLNNTVECFSGNTAELRGGETLKFDILITAVGVRPAVALGVSAGAAVNRGILINGKGETTVPGVYAAGDCCEGIDITSNTKKVIAILPNAYKQGYTAGVNMAGGSAVCDDTFPMNAMSFFGTHILSAGAYTGECYEKISGDSYKALYYGERSLNGFILIGDVARAGIYTSLIRNGTDLRTVDFDALKDHPQLMAFQPADRESIINEGMEIWKNKNA